MAGHDKTLATVSGISVSILQEDHAAVRSGAAFQGVVNVQENAVLGQSLVLVNSELNTAVLACALTPTTLWRASHRLFMLSPGKQAQQGIYCLRCNSEQAAAELQQVVAGQTGSSSQAAGGSKPGAAPAAARGQPAPGSGDNHFDVKIDKGSSELYFHYYGMLQHQQNMLQDYTRTGAYYQAIVHNQADFRGKAVMDVGAGSGILSLFSAQAGARVVYAVEASGMAKFAQQLAGSNPVGSVLRVLHGKVEEVAVPEKVDVLVSEPMGTLLVNERMLETYLYARDHFLKPGGKMFPQVGHVYVGAFSDEALYSEVASKAAFWLQDNFYGVDVTCLHKPASDAYFAQVVVDAFDPALVVSSTAVKSFDFGTISEAELQDIAIPLQLTVGLPCVIHGLATWFDVLFNGSSVQTVLSTGPGAPTTHWFQLRCVLQQPLFITRPGSVINGEMRLKAHARQSYDIHITLTAPPAQPGRPPQHATGVFDLKEPYYRQLNSWNYSQAAAAGEDGSGVAAAVAAGNGAAGAYGVAAGGAYVAGGAMPSQNGQQHQHQQYGAWS